jgi:hypothetical protein
MAAAQATKTMTSAKDVVVTRPDPTEAVKAALELAIKNLDDKISERFVANNAAVVLSREELRRELAALKAELQNAAMAASTANKDLVEKLEKANQVALTAALQTQKESAAKSEVAASDISRQLQVAFESANKATNEKIDRLTSRLDTGEGRTGGVDSNRQETHQVTVDNRSYIIALMGIIVVAAGIIVSVLVQRLPH